MSDRAKIAVVTGAAGGLGSQLCKMLAAAGIRLVLVDRDTAKSAALAADINRAFPGSVSDTASVDLADHADIKRVVAQLLAKYPAIHYLFNNAGVLTESLQFSSYGNELHFEVNALAPLQLIDGLRPALAAAGRAIVVNTSAGLALNVKRLDWNELVKPATFSKLFGPYATSKEALNVLSAALAPELRDVGIVIRCADPGPTRTRLTKGAGTPLWMRLFYAFLPGPESGARKIFETAFASKWGDATGIFVSGKTMRSLPAALESPAFQADLLQRCRKLVNGG